MTFIPGVIILFLINLVSSEKSTQTLLTVGCFMLSNNESNRSATHEALDLSHKTNISGRSAVACVSACRNKQFRYAGMIAGNECVCGNTFNGQPSDQCNSSCLPDSSHFCGGANSVSVYETGRLVPGPALQFQLVEGTSSGLHISWQPPIKDGSSHVLQYQVTATPLHSYSELEPPGLRTWEFGSKTTSAWLCGVHPATQYTVELRAANTEGLGVPITIESWTKIDYPSIPEQPQLLGRTPNTMILQLHPVTAVSGPITSYQVVVVDESVGAKMNILALSHYYNASKQMLPYYIAAQFEPDDFITVFTVGDGRTYGGYFNPPLKENIDYHILLGVISTLNITLSSYSASDHSQHTSSVTSDHILSKHEFEGLKQDSRTNRVSEHILGHSSGGSNGQEQRRRRPEPSGLVVGLSVSVGVLGCLVLVTVAVYVGLRIYMQKPRRPDHQELTVNSYECGGGTELPADGLGHYLPDDDELPDHYSRLKQRVAVLAPANLTIVGDVGQGYFGDVRKGVVRSGPQVHSGNHAEGSVLVQHILDDSLSHVRKAAMLRCLGQHVAVGRHKHVVSLLGLVEEVAAVTVVFDYHTATLKHYLTEARALTHYPVYAEKHRRFSTIAEQEVLSILCGVARGLQWLRCCGSAHGSICARNVVLVDGTLPKLTGFGLLAYHNDLYVPDYRRWTARELLGVPAAATSTTQGTPPISSLQGDVWSFGVLVWEAVTLGATPYPALRSEDLTRAVQTGSRPPQPSYVGDDLYQVMLDCWQLDPSVRPEFPQLEATLNQLAGEGSHLLFASFPDFTYHMYAPHQEFRDC